MDATRRLIVLRHAKSAWPDDVPDRERPLGPRGLRDAPKLGRWLGDNGYVPDRVLCSTARRTRETWERVSEAFSETPPVEYDEDLYGAGPEEFLAAARRIPDDVVTLALVGHEPGVSELTLHLAGYGDDTRLVRTKFPTGAAAVLVTTDTWAELATARLEAFFRPRD
ncbi:histidine phosphatase family protein [Amycolatopsis mongoliensis]|uniref:Histidine phosphatase family protein n=1 Tax=Amycolatopsis mongoliensis TaxID=715475 RepID=A0A9Y2JV45_9PSEU|nr:histidine phosphatase family protein [Amycolatopsis sp. 4-36]WIY04072.1 histidine phosphatase family protein [Amycolatopsis sp. 4-36]